MPVEGDERHPGGQDLEHLSASYTYIPCYHPCTTCFASEPANDVNKTRWSAWPYQAQILWHLSVIYYRDSYQCCHCIVLSHHGLSPDSYYPTPVFHRTDFSQSHTVDIPQELKDSIRKFRFARHKGNAALVVKINKQRLIMEQVETFDDITPEDLAEGKAC